MNPLPFIQSLIDQLDPTARKVVYNGSAVAVLGAAGALWYDVIDSAFAWNTPVSAVLAGVVTLGAAVHKMSAYKVDTSGNSVTVSPEGIAHVVTPETEQHFDLGTNG